MSETRCGVLSKLRHSQRGCSQHQGYHFEIWCSNVFLDDFLNSGHVWGLQTPHLEHLDAFQIWQSQQLGGV